MYIGSTTWDLHERAKEHIAAARNNSQTSAIGEHYDMNHPTSEPWLQIGIIRRTEKDELRLRIEEAMAIRDASPSLNRRKEETGIDFLAWQLNTYFLHITPILAPHSHQTLHQALSKKYLSRY